jgi:hypothetical protein
MVGILVLKSILYQNKESKHYESTVSIKNQECEMSLIYEFDEASRLSAKICSQPEWKENKAMHTLPEQALIALIGFSSLINQAVGGFLHTYNPDDEQRAVFKSLETRSIEAMQQNLLAAPADLINKLRTWAQSVFNHGTELQRSLLAVEGALSDPGSASKIDHFSEALQEAVMSQAIPALYRGQFTLFVTIGAEMSKDAYGKAEPFYTGQSRSADLMKKVLSKLYEREEDLKETSSLTINPLIELQGLPFVNLLPWLNSTKDDMSAAIHFLKRYIEITRPCIILTLGKQPSSVAAASFRHSLGYKGRDPFYHKVGVLEVVNCGDWSSVQIPCFHPGQVQYVKDSKLFYKAMNLTLSILLLTIKITMETHSAMEMSPQATRCIHIKDTVDGILQANGTDVLLKEIKDGMQAVKEKGNKFHPKEEVAARKGSIINALGSKSLPVSLNNTSAVDTTLIDIRTLPFSVLQPLILLSHIKEESRFIVCGTLIFRLFISPSPVIIGTCGTLGGINLKKGLHSSMIVLWRLVGVLPLKQIHQRLDASSRRSAPKETVYQQRGRSQQVN